MFLLYCIPSLTKGAVTEAAAASHVAVVVEVVEQSQRQNHQHSKKLRLPGLSARPHSCGQDTRRAVQCQISRCPYQSYNVGTCPTSSSCIQTSVLNAHSATILLPLQLCSPKPCSCSHACVQHVPCSALTLSGLDGGTPPLAATTNARMRQGQLQSNSNGSKHKRGVAASM